MAEVMGGIDGWFIADKIVAYLFIVLFIWGASNKFGKRDEFNEDFTSLSTMKSLQGFAALGVILHHISQEYFFQEEGVLSLFVNAGAYFVALFFFCSGYGLLKSYDTKKDYLKGFIGKRVVKALVIPFYVNVILYGIMMFLVKWPVEPLQWVTNFLGITMMNRYAWFPIILVLLYLVFYLCFRFIKNRPACFIVIGLFIISLGIITSVVGHVAWWAGPDNWWMDDNFWETDFKWWMDEQIFWFNGEWWSNSAPAFMTGLLFANYEKQIVAFFKKKYVLKLHILAVITLALGLLNNYGQSAFGYWTEWEGNGPAIGDKLATYFMQIPLLFVFPLLVFVVMMKYHVSNPVTRFFGKYSLHTYLMNLAAITFCRFLEVPDALVMVGDVKNNLFMFAIAVIILSVLLGMLEYKVTTAVQNLIYRKPAPAVVDTYVRPSLLEENGEHATRTGLAAELKAEEKAEEKAEAKA
ncbi:MAG: acyltransferase family protein [Clostridiales bacterium]|nr:acyltransferase family protein [Clostridiales bacterium]